MHRTLPSPPPAFRILLGFNVNINIPNIKKTSEYSLTACKLNRIPLGEPSTTLVSLTFWHSPIKNLEDWPSPCHRKISQLKIVFVYCIRLKDIFWCAVFNVFSLFVCLKNHLVLVIRSLRMTFVERSWLNDI